MFPESQGAGLGRKDPHVVEDIPIQRSLPRSETSTKVFFDVAADSKPIGRIEMILFDDVVPKTTANFKALAKGNLRVICFILMLFIVK